MRISQAATIGRNVLEPRIGAELYPPCDGSEKYGGCYRGMALVGAGVIEPIGMVDDGFKDDGFDLSTEFLEVWQWAGDTIAEHPCTCRDEKATIAFILTHLWDKHGTEADVSSHPEALDDPWSFERITEWVESLEPKEE